MTKYVLTHIEDWSPTRPPDLAANGEVTVVESPFSPCNKQRLRRTSVEVTTQTFEALLDRVQEIIGDNSEGGVVSGVETEPRRVSSIWLKYGLGSRAGKWREVFPFELSADGASIRALETEAFENQSNV